jgi:hypothetical protein
MVRNLITGQIVTATVNRMNINTYQFPNSLGLGSYSFSVSGLDASGLAGNRASTPAFRSTEPVTLVSPEGSMFNSFPTLTWLAVPGATSYEMTLRNSRTGVLIASEPSLTSTSWTPGTALAAGDYQWTVRGKLGTVLIGNWGLAKSFNNGGRPFLLTTSATTADRTPTITWSAVTGAVSYEINFIRVDTVSTVLYLQNLKGTSYTPLTDLDPRQYRIWVRAVSSTGVVSQWGNFIILTITSADAPANSDLDTLDSAVDFLMPEVFEDQEASDYTDRSVTARSSITMASKNEREPESGEEIDLSLEEAAAAQKVSDHIDFVMTEWALGY